MYYIENRVLQQQRTQKYNIRVVLTINTVQRHISNKVQKNPRCRRTITEQVQNYSKIL